MQFDDEPPIVSELHHSLLDTTFHGIVHPISTTETPILQYRGVKYASVPARFRQAKLFNSYSASTDATKFGPICPQANNLRSVEEKLFGIAECELPKQGFKQNEFECLNLNITCPAPTTMTAPIPVMVWIHGGGDQGSGSHWIYDGGAFVLKSLLMGTPVIVVNINFRLGLFGFAASPLLKEDNKAAGDEGVGNYGLRDQRLALEWIHHFIGDFGGDPSNVTLFGEATGASDILCHLLSNGNESRPLFHRAIVQSAVVEPTIPDVGSAGWQLSRLMGALQVSNVDQLRTIAAERIIAFGQTLRAVDDGVFFTKDWRRYFSSDEHRPQLDHPRLRRSISRVKRSLSRPAARAVLQLPSHLQPLIIGDAAADSLLWSLPASHWTAAAAVRRIKAICQSLSKASNLLHVYDICSHTPDEEITDRVLDLINDARIAWPTEHVSRAAKHDRGGGGVYRYVFDQEGPTRGLPHHGADLMYLFDNAPLPDACRNALTPPSSIMEPEHYYDSDSEEDLQSKFSSIVRDDDSIGTGSDADWVPSVDEYTYSRIRDTMQERWITFAYGDAPWNSDKVFVFGPEGETGERSDWIFEGRRRKHVWKEGLEPLGMHIVHKVGVELSRGPPLR